MTCRTRRSTADNHLYETSDALTKFLPAEYEGVVKYVEVNGRTKLAIHDRISDYIPNPTFGKVAVPGGAGFDVTKGGTAAVRRRGRRAAGRWSRCRASTPSSTPSLGWSS